ncbi:MAG: GAF domain-containing protein, partial [Dehalococcoidia bacterium]
ARAGLARQVERLRVLTGITNQLLAATELDAVLSVVVESAMRLCDTAGAAVGLIQSDGREIAFAATAGEPRDYFEMYRPATIDDGFLAGTAAGRALVQGRAVIVDDYATWGDPDTPHEQRVATIAHQLHAFIVAPLLVDGAPIGLLRVHHTAPRSFAAEDAALIQALADQAALAIEHTRLLQRGQEAAILEERARLARELHDSVTQSIFSLGMLAQAARTQHVRAPDRLGPTLERVSSLAQEALIEMRSLLFELQPAALAEQGLASALDRLVAAMRMRGDLTLTYTAATAARLDANTELALFRIAQESLANVIKHAHATEVAITLSEADDHLILTVMDNGGGFDLAVPVTPSEDGSRGGMGLRSMRERAATAGITVAIRSSPATGTAVTATAPLSPA